MTFYELIEQLTLTEATRWLAAAHPGTPDMLVQAEAYYEGDHWQGGKGWAGPKPDLEHPDYRDTLHDIEAAFTSANTVAEVVGRHTSGVVGIHPAWGLLPTTPPPVDEATGEAQPLPLETQALIDEAQGMVDRWMRDREVVALLQEEVVPKLLYSGRSVVRLFVPFGLLERTGEDGAEGQLPQAQSTSEAASVLYIDSPDLLAAGVYLHRESMQRVGIYLYHDPLTRRQFAEVSYLDEQGDTVLRTLGGADGEELGRVTTPLGGNLWSYEAKRKAIIDRQVVQLQKQLNMSLTMMGRNVVLAGFLERIILNGQLPYKKVRDPDTGLVTLEQVPFQTGAGATMFIAGVTTTDETTGRKSIANPSVVYRDPVPPDTFLATADAYYRKILHQTHQLHTVLAGEAVAAAISRIHSRADFTSDLEKTATQVEGLLVWLVNTLLHAAGELSGNSGRYTELRPTVQVMIDPGPITGDERRAIIESYQAGLISKRTAIKALGIVDAEAEIAELDKEAAQSLPALQGQADVIHRLSQAGAGLYAAALAAGLTEEEAATLARADYVDGVTQ